MVVVSNSTATVPVAAPGSSSSDAAARSRVKRRKFVIVWRVGDVMRAEWREVREDGMEEEMEEEREEEREEARDVTEEGSAVESDACT